MLGANHDAANTTIPLNLEAYPYARGWGRNGPDGFETIMSQRFDSLRFPARLLEFSNPDLTYNTYPTGDAVRANNALVLINQLPSTAALRTRPERIFASGFDETVACPGVNY